MPSHTYQLDKFNTEYNRLNEQQKRAVDTTEGPVMVIAGPGTGKTQILSARIGKILLDTDTQPQKIFFASTHRRRYCLRETHYWFYWRRCVQGEHLYISCFFCNDVIQG